MRSLLPPIDDAFVAAAGSALDLREDGFGETVVLEPLFKSMALNTRVSLGRSLLMSISSNSRVSFETSSSNTRSCLRAAALVRPGGTGTSLLSATGIAGSES